MCKLFFCVLHLFPSQIGSHTCCICHLLTAARSASAKDDGICSPHVDMSPNVTCPLRHFSHCDTVPFLPLSPVIISFAQYFFFQTRFHFIILPLGPLWPDCQNLHYVLLPFICRNTDALVDEHPRPRAPFNGPHMAKKRAEVGRHGPQSALSC